MPPKQRRIFIYIFQKPCSLSWAFSCGDTSIDLPLAYYGLMSIPLKFSCNSSLLLDRHFLELLLTGWCLLFKSFGSKLASELCPNRCVVLSTNNFIHLQNDNKSSINRYSEKEIHSKFCNLFVTPQYILYTITLAIVLYG